MTLVFSIAFTAMFFSNVFFLTERWQLSIFEAGLRLRPGRSRSSRSPYCPALADRFGYRPLFVTGGLLSRWRAVAVAPRFDMPAGFLVWFPGCSSWGPRSAWGAAVAERGRGLAARRGQLRGGQRVNQAVRQLGSVLGVAIVVVVLASSARPLISTTCTRSSARPAWSRRSAADCYRLVALAAESKA